MDDIDLIVAQAARMAEEGIRRLLLLSGDEVWSEPIARRLRQRLGGDGLWIGPDAQAAPYSLPSAAGRLLGREFQHAFFDARRGFDVAAFAALAGMLVAGSWLVLLVPPLSCWAQCPDADSVRWNDSAEPLPAPHFIHHFRRILLADTEAAIWQQSASFICPDFSPRPRWQAAGGDPLADQAHILDALSTMPPGVVVVTAGRGRGKSALAGMHLRRLGGQTIVTAPAKGATNVLADFAAGADLHFMAPDALLASTVQADWLIVDEAAAIPGPLLEQLVRRFPRALLTTTVQGYEGTGRGFMLKFCARFPQLRAFTLDNPVRWAAGCPLESLVDRALLFDDALPEATREGELIFTTVEQRAWESDPELPEAMYRLLSAAHYRTSPLDLRRMMDAPGQHFACVRQQGHSPIGALWLVEEGGLAPELSQAVWAGFRRPRGNLVAQSLAAHGGNMLAATLKGLRISRIAVHPQRQREGIGQEMIARLVAQTHGYDYLSVSFGYTEELAAFWRRCGFSLVRVGTRREASSGCYTAIALLAFSEAGEALRHQEQQRMERDACWLDAWREGHSLDDIPPLVQLALTNDDWLELAGFAFASRPLTAGLGSLNRLIINVSASLPLLHSSLQQMPEAELCREAGLSGRKALLAAIRNEVAAALRGLDAARSHMLEQQVKSCSFFN